MSYLDQESYHARNATAYFTTREAADAAVNDLISAGFPREQISVTGTAGGTGEIPNQRSFWEELKDLFLPAEDRYTYAEGLRRGGVVVSVRSDEGDYDRALEILDRDGAVDLDKQEASWRQEGWTGYQGGEAAAESSMAAVTSQADVSAPSQSGTAATPRAVAPATSGTDQVVPVYEEQLRIGKRDVSHGRVRIRSYVVETPVNEQVRLRNESVQIERKPVDRPVAPEGTLFQDRVIETEERGEEAVIAKETRVKEEVSLRTTAEDRTQQISDAVRHTEVEVEDDRSGAGLNEGVGEQVAEHMDVIGSDGIKIGTVDHLDGPDKIKLAKSTSPDGQHHYIPLAWVDHVDAHVHLSRPSADVRAGW